MDKHEPPSEVDSFVKLATTYPAQAALMLFWMNRHRNPDFTVEVTTADLAAFRQCVEYLDVAPELRIYRPPGIPAQEAKPAEGNRRAIPGRAARPGKNVAIIQMVDAEGNGFVPIENNEDDQKKGKRFADQVAARSKAAGTAAALLQMLGSGTTSTSMIQEAAHLLNVLGQVD